MNNNALIARLAHSLVLGNSYLTEGFNLPEGVSISYVGESKGRHVFKGTNNYGYVIGKNDLLSEGDTLSILKESNISVLSPSQFQVAKRRILESCTQGNKSLDEGLGE